MPQRCGKPIDLVIVRENTEGFYADRNMFMGNGEFMPTPDVALSLRKITARGSRRIAATAFRLARERPRKKVTAVHKANVLHVTDGLFLEACALSRRISRGRIRGADRRCDGGVAVRDASAST